MGVVDNNCLPPCSKKFKHETQMDNGEGLNSYNQPHIQPSVILGRNSHERWGKTIHEKLDAISNRRLKHHGKEGNKSVLVNTFQGLSENVGII